jgi:hypothetical protein
MQLTLLLSAFTSSKDGIDASKRIVPVFVAILFCEKAILKSNNTEYRIPNFFIID